MRYLYLPSVLSLGLLGSLLGWAASQLVGTSVTSLLQLQGELVPLLHYVWEGAFLGAGLGLVLQIREIYFQGSELDSLLKQGLHGFFDGLLLGFGAVLFSLTLAEWFPGRQESGLLYAIILGAGLGLVTTKGHAAWSYRVTLSACAALGGGGSFFLLLTLQSTHLVQGFSSWIPLLTMGLGISLLLGLPEALFTRSRLHLLTGERAGHVYWLHPFYNALGYGLHNNLILHPYREVRGQQACILRRQQQLVLQNFGDPQEVLLNFRPVSQQELQSGDLIKIGTALLQFTR